jgi:hypothetical protein
MWYWIGRRHDFQNVQDQFPMRSGELVRTYPVIGLTEHMQSTHLV